MSQIASHLLALSPNSVNFYSDLMNRMREDFSILRTTWYNNMYARLNSCLAYFMPLLKEAKRNFHYADSTEVR